MTSITKTIKIEVLDKKILALYKLENDLSTYSEAIRHAIGKAQGKEKEKEINPFAFI